MLKGPTGCGKTRFVEHMAWRLGRPLVTVACHDDLSASDLTGRYLIRGSDSAYVTAVADMRAGATVDGRMYTALHPARRELAVALLADVSASTDAWVSTNRRIVAVEKEALMIVCEALDAPGDRHGIFAFSGDGADDVSVVPLKRLGERLGVTVRQRIAALDADRYTRLGAPVRHLTAARAKSRRGAGSRHQALVFRFRSPLQKPQPRSGAWWRRG